MATFKSILPHVYGYCPEHGGSLVIGDKIIELTAEEFDNLFEEMAEAQSDAAIRRMEAEADEVESPIGYGSFDYEPDTYGEHAQDVQTQQVIDLVHEVFPGAKVRVLN